MTDPPVTNWPVSTVRASGRLATGDAGPIAPGMTRPACGKYRIAASEAALYEDDDLIPVQPRRRPARPRISEATHRQLKLASAFSGITVQDLVEQAIRDFLTKHPELHPSLGPSRSPKSTPRKPR